MKGLPLHPNFPRMFKNTCSKPRFQNKNMATKFIGSVNYGMIHTAKLHDKTNDVDILKTTLFE